MRNTMEQKGFALIGLLVGVAIVGLISSSAGLAVSQSIRFSHWGNDKFEALHDIENAAYWISRDGRMADTTDLVDGAQPVSGVTFQWVDQFDLGSVQHTSTYQIVGNEIHRNYDGVTRILARNISQLGFSLNSQLITVTMASSPPGYAEVREEGNYLIYLRPSG